MARAATAAARTAPAPRHAPRRAPSRTGRPARRRSGPASGVASAAARALPLPRALEFPRLGPVTQGLLDRLLRGRAWVLLIGILLVGVVFLNVDVLRLNRSIASVSDRATALKQQNARLLLEEAKLASSDRIQQAAAAAGMVLPAPGEVRYLKARHGNASRASQNMTAPQPVPPPAATPQTQQTPGTAAPPAGAEASPTTTTTTTTGTGTTSGGGTTTTTPPPATPPPATPPPTTPTGGVTP